MMKRTGLLLALLGVILAMVAMWPPSTQIGGEGRAVAQQPAASGAEKAQLRTEVTLLAKGAAAASLPSPAAESESAEWLQAFDRQKRETKSQRAAPAVPADAPLIAGRQWRMMQQGRETVMELALDEVWVSGGEGGAGLVAIPAQADVAGVAAQAEALRLQSGGRVRLVMYPRGSAERSGLTRRLLTESLLLEWDGREETRQRLEAAGVSALEKQTHAEELWTARATGDAAAPLRVLQALEGLPGLKSVEPMLARQQQKKAAPNDLFFPHQWHLKNTGQGSGKAGTDANITAVWDNFQGAGLRIGVVDDGVDLAHPDLADNKAPDGHHDWNGDDDDPSPSTKGAIIDDHGTAVAGVAAARGGNGIGVSGAAPLAKIVGLRLISEPSTDEMESEAMLHENDVIAIKNNSWGPDDDASVLGAIGTLTRQALQSAATSGRGGKGVIVTWAAGNGRGNGDQSNKDNYANNRHVLAVGAVTNKGLQSSYSESGANVVVSAPSSGGTRQIVTTDLRGTPGYNSSGSPALGDRDYTNSFGGTSSATPLVSGVVALMLEANPNLNYRDVKEILLRSSVQLLPTSTDWIKQTGGRPDLSPIRHHHGFGGGMVNAGAAVAMASSWITLPAQAASQSASVSPNADIPDGSDELSQTFSFSAGNPLRVETVEITVNIPHKFRGDLQIDLISPRGVNSRLVTASAYDDGYDPSDDSSGNGFQPWTFSSLRHWGESSAGDWRVIVKDLAVRDTGRLVSATVRIYGTSQTVPVLTGFGSAQMLAEGDDAVFTSSGTGTGFAYEWRRQGVAVGGTLTTNFTLQNIQVAQAGNYTVAAMTSVGEDQSAPIPVSVVRVEGTGLSALEGKTLTLTATAAGPLPLSYQWQREGVPLVEGVNGTGTQSKTLVITNCQASHAGNYECVVSDGTRTMSAGARPVVVILKPVMELQMLANTVVSGQPFYSFGAVNGATKFVATGVPAGMKFNAATGELTGRPLKPGNYTVKIYAQNLAGRSAVVEYPLVVEDLPLGAVNRFRGLVDADVELNQLLGGSVLVTVAKTGSFTASMTIGTKAYSFRGFLNAQPGGVKPLAAVTLKRRGLQDLRLNFEIDPVTCEISGNLETDTASTDWEAQGEGWNSRTNPALARAGYFTVALDSVGGPVGKGFLTATVSTSGAVRLTGRTGEAMPFTYSATLSLAGEVPVYVRTDSSRSSLLGWLQVSGGTTAPLYPEAAVGGALDWRRLEQPAGTRLYQPGFLVALTAAGGKHVKPLPGAILMQLADPATLPDGRNAKVAFTGDTVAAALMAGDLADVRFSLTDKNKAVFALAKSADNAASVKLTISPTTGLVSGSFVASDPNPSGGAPVLRSVKFYGLAFETHAEGCFVMPELPEPLALPPTTVKTTAIQSGAFQIIAP